MARKVTRLAFEKWIGEEENVLDVLTRIAGGLTLQKASVAVKQPYTCLQEYFRSSDERGSRLAAAREMWVQARKDGLVAAVEACPPDRDHVARLKLEAEIIDNQAKAYHRDMWGDRVHVEKTVTVGVDAALLGRADDLLRLANEKVVAEVPALPVRLPAE